LLMCLRLLHSIYDPQKLPSLPTALPHPSETLLSVPGAQVLTLTLPPTPVKSTMTSVRIGNMLTDTSHRQLKQILDRMDSTGKTPTTLVEAGIEYTPFRPE